MSNSKDVTTTEPPASSVISFSTERFRPADRFEAWRTVLGATHDVTDADHAGFFGHVHSTAIDRMIVRRMKAAPQAVQRTARRCRKDGLDHIVVHLTTAPFRFEAGAGTVAVPRHAITINALARPFTRSKAPELDSAILSLPRNLVAEVIGDPEALHGTVLRDGFAQLFGAHMRCLSGQAGGHATMDAAGLARATVHLLAAGLQPDGRIKDDARRIAEAAALLRCKRHIEANLRSPALTGQAVATAMGVSRSALYRLFESAGGIGSYVRGRRLNAVRAALVAFPDRRVAEVARSFGFNDIPAFNRAFRSTYGMAPSDIWREVRPDAQAEPLRAVWLQPGL